MGKRVLYPKFSFFRLYPFLYPLFLPWWSWLNKLSRKDWLNEADRWSWLDRVDWMRLTGWGRLDEVDWMRLTGLGDALASIWERDLFNKWNINYYIELHSGFRFSAVLNQYPGTYVFSFSIIINRCTNSFINWLIHVYES